MKKQTKPGEMFNKFQKKKNWIAGAIKKPGTLHRELGVPQGKKIPPKKLTNVAKKGGKEGKRARLAQTLKSFNHKNKKKGILKGVQDFAGKAVGRMGDVLKLTGQMGKAFVRNATGGDIKPLAESWGMKQKLKTKCKKHKKAKCKMCKK